MDMRFDWTISYDTKFFQLLVHELCEQLEQERNSKGQSRIQLAKTRSKERKTATKLIQALYTAYYTVPKATSRIVLPLTTGFYKETPYSHSVVKRLYDKMVKIGWIDSQIGQEGQGYTRIWPIGQLSLWFDAIGFKWLPQKLIPPHELIILRDYASESSKKKILVGTPDDEFVVRAANNLFQYNHFLTQHCLAMDLDDQQLVSLAQSMAEKVNQVVATKTWSSETEKQQLAYLDFSRVQLVRIFARGSLQKGGRFYRGWWQAIPSNYRPHITIDGYRTCEIDFSGVAIYIMYAQQNLQFPHERDPYDIGLIDWQGDVDPRRKLIKRFFNAKINDETGRFRLDKLEQEQLGINHDELLSRILDAHAPIADQLQSGAGLNTQFIDSEIAEYVMLEMMQKNIVVLPIHDSFIVREGYEADLKGAMLIAFNTITKMTGAVTVDYSRLPIHFGMSGVELEAEQLKMIEDPSYGIVGVDDVAPEIIGQTHSIMDGYVGAWHNFIAN